MHGTSKLPSGPRYIATDVMYDLLHLSPHGYEVCALTATTHAFACPTLHAVTSRLICAFCTLQLFAEILLAALKPMLDGEPISGVTHRTHANRSVRDGLLGARCIGLSLIHI